MKFPKGINTIITASWKSSPEGTSDAINVFPASKGVLTKISFKSFRGLLRELINANKNCRKYGFTTEIRIKLPLNW